MGAAAEQRQRCDSEQGEGVCFHLESHSVHRFTDISRKGSRPDDFTNRISKKCAGRSV
jgi:hypothetical protein